MEPAPTTTDEPALAVVIAARDAADTLRRCLAALGDQLAPGDEVVVVDDASTNDGTRRAGERFAESVAGRVAVHVLAMERNLGPAAARNRGVGATTAPVLFFLDADTEPVAGAVDRARRAMADPTVDAVIGSYDDAPAVTTVVSRFKNLTHHYVHQLSAGEAATFWAACGLVRRELFVDCGGFDAERYPAPSIEDIELGVRMAARGATIRLDPTIQVKHLKQWTMGSLLATDLLRRAIPWTRLCLARGHFPPSLNLRPVQRVAALLPVATIAAIAWAALTTGTPSTAAWAVAGSLLVAAALVNLGLFALFWRNGGARLAIGGFLLMQLYYLNSLAGLAIGALAHLADGAQRQRRTA